MTAPPPLTLGGPATVGEAVVAVGAPSGGVTGIVSAVGRDVRVGGVTLPVLQTDVTIDAGNAGGPLVDGTSAVVGLNTVVPDGARGLGFAEAATRIIG
ncbi:trypsin-like peptidase domain-containing protein [Actinophytocola sp. NPDC049390]|uniref:trypsin-like peptidase domain-containing protein n=1 Tax=Actinophytocola sp. NPDC049390 TaxID=3363894 RepID=UPI0037A4332A